MKTHKHNALDTPPSKENKFHASNLIIFVNLIFLVAVIFIALRWADWKTLIAAVIHINILWLAVAVFLQCGTYLCVSFSWYSVLSRLKMHISLRSLLPLSVAKLFLDQMVPAFGLGGTALAVRGFLRRGTADSAAVAVAAIYTISELAINLFFLFVAFLILTIDHYINPLFSLFNTVLVFSGGVILLSSIGYFIRNSAFVRYIQALKPVAWLIQMVYGIPRSLLKDAGMWASVSSSLAMVWLLDAATLWVLLLALGVSASILKILACSIVASVLAAIVIIPGGLGLFEGSSIAFMSLFGIPLEQAIASSILMRGLTYWLPMIPGFLIARYEFSSRKWHESSH